MSIKSTIAFYSALICAQLWAAAAVMKNWPHLLAPVAIIWIAVASIFLFLKDEEDKP